MKKINTCSDYNTCYNNLQGLSAESTESVLPNGVKKPYWNAVYPLNLYVDTEFNQRLEGMNNLSIQVFCPELDAIEFFDKEDIASKTSKPNKDGEPCDEFDIIVETLKANNYKVKDFNHQRRNLEAKLTERFRKLRLKSLSKTNLEKFKIDKEVVIYCNQFKIDISKTTFEYSRKTKKVHIKLQSRRVDLQMFFAYADLFRLFAKKSQIILSERAKLTQYRTIKILGKVSSTLLIDDELVEVKVDIFDSRYCFPPRNGSLDGQFKTFNGQAHLDSLYDNTKNSEIKRLLELSKGKLNLSDTIKQKYGVTLDETWCKENMDVIRADYPDINRDYAMIDTLVTYATHQALESILKSVCELLQIESSDLKETCGANIASILYGLVHKHLKSNDDNEDELKDLKKMFEMGGTKHLSQLDHNLYGRIPFSVVGGLLYTRTSKDSVITGKLADLDESSCYATVLCNSNLYIGGEPVVIDFLSGKNKVRDVIQAMLSKPKDSWYLRVSGSLNNAINTLVLSDDSFESGTTYQNDPKKYAYPDEYDIDKDTINRIDATKVPEPIALSKILTKEINHGVITAATWLAILDLPDAWIKEYLDLSIDNIIYYPESLMTDNLKDYYNLKEKFPESNRYGESLFFDDLLNPLDTKTKQLYSSNVCLRIPIGKYYSQIKELRKIYKSDKNPIQEIFKLILNSTYGILASQVMFTNNPVLGNWITSCARAACWRMVVSLNGFGPITDGTGFNLETVPFGMTFKEVLVKYPDYLTNYETNISNNRDCNFTNENDFNKDFKNHLKSFFGKTDWLTDMFDYALKGESNEFHYSKHYNTGAGNYLKAGNHEDVLKMRSYRSNNALKDWFKETTDGEYRNHVITVDREILKLSSGTLDAKNILKSASEVFYKNKFDTRMSMQMAELIVTDGICHPMGFSKDVVKIPKLISPSQFLCQDFRQYKILASFYDKCNTISREILESKDFKRFFNWGDLSEKIDGIKMFDYQGRPYNINYRDDVNYEKFSRDYPTGLGMELLCYGNRNFNSIKDVRVALSEILDRYHRDDEHYGLIRELNFDNIVENLKQNNELKEFLITVQIARSNCILDYRETLINSVDDPLAFVVKDHDIDNLRDSRERFLEE